MRAMRILVIGANGGSGKQVIERGLAAHHEMIAGVRKPESYQGPARVVKADVQDAASLVEAISGTDAVISTFGPPDLKNPGTLMSEGVTNIVRACEQARVKRFVFESGLMTSDGTGLGFGARTGLAFFRWLYKKAAIDKRKAEDAMRASSLEWVVVRPVVLVAGPPKGTYIHGESVSINPMKKLAHADVADFLLRCATEPGLARTAQNVGEA
jgi:uncharacterized protein YbjT (DUF2867 family)